jgi:hypothetical protein
MISKIKIKLIVFLCIFFSFSCNKLILEIITKNNIDKDIKIYENKDNKILFIPIVHLGKKGYYESIKKKIDSLRKEDFLILYEGVKLEGSKDSTKMKFRKVTGFHLTNYDDKNNNSISKSFKNKKFEKQTNEKIGVNNKIDINIDYCIDSLVYLYEKRDKKITLEDYDLKTPLNDKYKIKNKNNYNSYLMINTIRNEKIKATLKKYKENNIVLVYGKGHRFVIHAFLLDNDYKLIKGKL